MRLSSPLNLSLGLLSLDLLSSVSADFHVGSLVVSGFPRHGACPSNYYNCQCFANGDRFGHATLPSGQILIRDYFQVSGLCGMPKLDFYKRSDGHWDFYKNGGSGVVEGTCYTSNSPDKECVAGGRVVWDDLLVCYSYVCGK